MKTEEKIKNQIERCNIYLDYWKENLTRDRQYEQNQIPNDEKAIQGWENYIAALEWVLSDKEGY